jgi:hypothetical protein
MEKILFESEEFFLCFIKEKAKIIYANYEDIIFELLKIKNESYFFDIFFNGIIFIDNKPLGFLPLEIYLEITEFIYRLPKEFKLLTRRQPQERLLVS